MDGRRRTEVGLHENRAYPESARARPLFHASRAFGSWFQHGIRDLASAICVYSLTELHMYIWITFDFGGTVTARSHAPQRPAAVRVRSPRRAVRGRCHAPRSRGDVLPAMLLDGMVHARGQHACGEERAV